MTPKEKAIELVNQYLSYVDSMDVTTDISSKEWAMRNAKKCAIICVNEIIKTLRKDSSEIGFGKGYWYLVKKEIEQL